MPSHSGVWTLFVDFSGWTSAHGVPQIGAARNAIVRTVWTVLFLFAFCMFVYQLLGYLKLFFSYPVSVSLAVNFEARYFPAVTICSGTPYRWELIQNDDADQQPMLAMLKDYKDYESTNTTAPPDVYGFTQYAGVTNQPIRKRLSDLFAMGIARKWDNATMTKYAYELVAPAGTSDADSRALLRDCTFSGVACNETHFTTYTDPMFGRCYTFNDGNETNPPAFISTRTGPDYGLKMQLATLQELNLNSATAEDRLFVPNTWLANVKVAVHKHGVYPFVDSYSYTASTGFTNSLAVKYTRFERKEPPYGTCTVDGTGHTDNYPGTYTYEGCIRTCIQDKVIADAGCAHPQYEAPAGSTFCDSLTQMQAILAWEEANKDVDTLYESCGCEWLCNRTMYAVTAAQASWPAQMYYPLDCFNITEYDTEAKKRKCTNVKRGRFLTVEVYYALMSYEFISESPSYGIQDLVFSLGGTIGLWLGFSMITCVEWCSLLVIIFCYCCAKFSGPDVTPESKHETEIDTIENWVDKKIAKSEKRMAQQGDDYYDGGGGGMDEPPPAPVS